MKIENLLFNNLKFNNSDNILKEGTLFKGEILEIFEEFVLLEIIGYGTIKATLDGDVNLLEGNEMRFLVKSNEDGKIKIKPLVNEELQVNRYIEKIDNPVSEILTKFNIVENKLSIDLVKNLMKYNTPINEKNIIEGIKTLEKLVELISLESDNKVIMFENEIVSKNELIYKEDIKLSNRLLEKDNSKDLKVPEKVNIKNLLIVDKNSYPDKTDLSNLVKEFIGNEVKIEDPNLNKIISFFIKNHIEPSLNNIKNLSELVKEPMEFSKDFVNLNKVLINLVESKESKINFDKLKDIDFNMDINKENIEITEKNIKLLQEITEKSNSKIMSTSNFKKEINELENKIDFLKEMDKNLSFIFIPINYGKKELDGVLTLLKENKNKKSMDDKINIFINLDTNNLGNIKISCLAKQEILSIKINIQKSDLKLFQLAEQSLLDKIESTGYTINNIEFIVDKDLNVMDNIGTNSNPNYFLDIKV